MLHKNKLTRIDTMFLVHTHIVQILSLPAIKLSQQRKKKKNIIKEIHAHNS